MDVLIVSLLMFASVGLLFVGDTPSEPGDPTPEEPNLKTFGDDDDSVTGTTGSDVFRFGDGDDIGDGAEGNDLLFGEDGDDQISGGPGDDRIFLGDGADRNFVATNSNPDQVAGDDLIRGGDRSDLIIDFLGSNTIYGDLGPDFLDTVDAAGEPDTPDSLFGGFGADVLAGDGGDIMSGGAAEDVFFVILSGGGGDPAVITDYEAGERLSVTVPLAFQDQTATLQPFEGGLNLMLGDQVILRLEGVTDPGTVALDFTAGDIADQTIQPGELALGTKGDDALTTGDGDDAVFTGRGDDVVRTGAGDDYISLRGARPFEVAGSLGWGSNDVDAGTGDDRVLGGMGNDLVRGGGGNDLIVGGGGTDSLFGGTGNDLIDAFDNDPGGADIVDAGAGDDRLLLDDGDRASGGSGRDTFDAVDYAAGDAPITITDFNPAQDSLSAFVTGGSTTVTYELNGTDTEVRIGNRLVFTLENIRPADLRDTTVAVSRGA